MSVSNSFWAFMELCDIRRSLCPEDYEKIQTFIKEWYRKDADFSRWHYDLDFGLDDMEEWWKYGPPTMTDLFGLFGLMVPFTQELVQSLKTESLPSSLLKRDHNSSLTEAKK